MAADESETQLPKQCIACAESAVMQQSLPGQRPGSESCRHAWVCLQRSWQQVLVCAQLACARVREQHPLRLVPAGNMPVCSRVHQKAKAEAKLGQAA